MKIVIRIDLNVSRSLLYCIVSLKMTQFKNSNHGTRHCNSSQYSCSWSNETRAAVTHFLSFDDISLENLVIVDDASSNGSVV